MRKVLRFLIERPGRAFTLPDISSALRVSQITTSGYCYPIIKEITNYSEVYSGFREGRAPTKYGLKKVHP